jgi:hypothetical protein
LHTQTDVYCTKQPCYPTWLLLSVAMDSQNTRNYGLMVGYHRGESKIQIDMMIDRNVHF